MAVEPLPFTIETHLADRRGNVTFVAIVGGCPIATVTYKPGAQDKRNRAARDWSKDDRLRNGRLLTSTEVSQALESAEIAVMPQVEAALAGDDEKPLATRCASIVSNDIIAELAWNLDAGGPDFLVFDRQSETISRAARVEVGAESYVPPLECPGIVTPGYPLAGTVLLPTEHDETGLDEDMLRLDLLAFIRRFVELPGDTDLIAVEYALLTWVFDAFDELGYLAFRTADAGRGKSRALETVGALCYRPIFCGGGSTAAATLRLLHTFGGTLVADEFDQRDTELAAEITKIINQGFQRNRPLVRCDGESNTPKAFRCFGPKLFALRKGFVDDASETRCLSIRMAQRTRRDIPINLPRARFDAEAGALRNRLLAWRFASLGRVKIDPTHVDPRLEDRFNQIGLPLMAVAGTPESRRRIVGALLSQQGEVAADRADSLAGEVFAAVMRIAKPSDVVRPGEAAAEVNRRRAAVAGIEVDRLGKSAIKPHRVGWVLKGDLELPRERDRDGTAYRLTPDRMGLLTKRFGTPPATLPPLQHCHRPHELPPENAVFESENAVCGNGGNCGNYSGGPTGAEHEIATESPSAPDSDTSDRDERAAIRDADGEAEADPRVPAGWSATSWVTRLRELADGCESLNPDRAAELRADAIGIEGRRP